MPAFGGRGSRSNRVPRSTPGPVRQAQQPQLSAGVPIAITAELAILDELIQVRPQR
jgi:hypothetical protein